MDPIIFGEVWPSPAPLRFLLAKTVQGLAVELGKTRLTVRCLEGGRMVLRSGVVVGRTYATRDMPTHYDVRCDDGRILPTVSPDHIAWAARPKTLSTEAEHAGR